MLALVLAGGACSWAPSLAVHRSARWVLTPPCPQVHGITNYLVGAMDKETGQVGAAAGGPALLPAGGCCDRLHVLCATVLPGNALGLPPCLGVLNDFRSWHPGRPLQALADRGLNVFAMYDTGSADTGLGTADFGWGTAAFHKMGRQKVRPCRGAAIALHRWPHGEAACAPLAVPPVRLAATACCFCCTQPACC